MVVVVTKLRRVWPRGGAQSWSSGLSSCACSHESGITSRGPEELHHWQVPSALQEADVELEHGPLSIRDSCLRTHGMRPRRPVGARLLSRLAPGRLVAEVDLVGRASRQGLVRPVGVVPVVHQRF